MSINSTICNLCFFSDLTDWEREVATVYNSFASRRNNLVNISEEFFSQDFKEGGTRLDGSKLRFSAFDFEKHMLDLYPNFKISDLELDIYPSDERSFSSSDSYSITYSFTKDRKDKDSPVAYIHFSGFYTSYHGSGLESVKLVRIRKSIKVVHECLFES